MEFAELVGKVLVSIKVNDAKDQIWFVDDQGKEYSMHHYQDCCETVEIESIVGDLNDLLNTPVLKAEEAESNDTPDGALLGYEPESATWTFYKLATIKGYVDIRWFGSSNGYYSESVSFVEVEKKNPKEDWKRAQLLEAISTYKFIQ
jgi:hypothetical protein